MKRTFYIFFLATLSFLFISFTSDTSTNKNVIKILSLNSDQILIDGKEAKPGMMISLNSQISFTNPLQCIDLLNQGDENKIECLYHGSEIWKKGEYRKIDASKEKIPQKLAYWIRHHKTSSKSSSIFFSDIEYIIGNKRSFRIEDKIVNYDEQFYKFTIIDGENSGKYFIAYPDNSEAVIWITRELFQVFGIDINQEKDFELNIKVTYHNFGESFIIKDSMKMIFIK